MTGEALEAWETWLRAAGRPSTTIGLRLYHVRRVFAELDVDPWSVTTEQLLEHLASKGWAPETRRSYRASLRAFYAWAQATGRRLDSPAHLLPVITVPRRLPRPTPEKVYRQALLEADERGRLLLQLAAICGLRRGELARLRREDLEMDLLGWSISVQGKGGHIRSVPLTNDLARQLRALPPGYVFQSRKGGGPLTPGHIGVLVRRMLPEGWSCHTLRHRCATVAYHASHDLRAVQELLGHAKPETTALYTLVPRQSVRHLVEATAADLALGPAARGDQEADQAGQGTGGDVLQDVGDRPAAAGPPGERHDAGDAA